MDFWTIEVRHLQIKMSSLWPLLSSPRVSFSEPPTFNSFNYFLNIYLYISSFRDYLNAFFIRLAMSADIRLRSMEALSLSGYPYSSPAFIPI